MKKTSGNGGAARRRLPWLTVADGLVRHPFDAEFGVRTSGLVAGRHLKSGHRHDRHATAYYGVAPSVFRALMRRWRESRPGAAIEATAFIDVGAGMGRGVLLASRMRFRSVMGVELNPILVRIARRNLTVWRRSGLAKAPMRMACGDAAEFAFPAGPCAVFLFNPFGATVMRRLLAALSRSFAGQPRQVDLLYVNNEQESVLETQRGWVRLFSGKVKRSRADTVADHAILNNQPDGEYVASDHEDCSIWRWKGKDRG